MFKVVENKIGYTLVQRFPIIFNGWRGGDTHCDAVLASYPASKTLGYNIALLASSLLENEESQNETKHYLFLVLSNMGLKRIWKHCRSLWKQQQHQSFDAYKNQTNLCCLP